MKIQSIFHIKASNISFQGKRIVDYGAKDKNLIYIPILFEEDDDTFESTANYQNEKKEETPFVPKKPKNGNLTTLITGGTATAIALPETAKALVKSYSNTAKEAMEEIKSVKDSYNNTFKNNNNETKADDINQHQEQSESVDSDFIDWDNYNIHVHSDEDSKLSSDSTNDYFEEDDDNYNVEDDTDYLPDMD